MLCKSYTSVDTVKYLLRLSITKRLDSLAVSQFQVELENSISSLRDDGAGRGGDTKAVYDRLATYESIKEGTSILELALWKAKIVENSNKRARVSKEGVSYKEQCRVNSGAVIVIRNVLLPYLLPYYQYQGEYTEIGLLIICCSSTYKYVKLGTYEQ